MEKVIHKYIIFFRAIHRRNNGYFAKFIFCECANFVILFATCYGTDVFLHGKFSTYGWDVVQWYRQHGRSSSRNSADNHSPFCTTFPTEVSCTIPNIGAGGRGQRFNGLCVLSQNIINEKIYLLIWFWLLILSCIAVLHFLFRIATLFSSPVRRILLLSRMGVPNDFVNQISAKRVQQLFENYN